MSDEELSTTVDRLSIAGILVTGAAVLGTIWHGGPAKLLQSRQTGKPMLQPVAQ